MVQINLTAKIENQQKYIEKQNRQFSHFLFSACFIKKRVNIYFITFFPYSLPFCNVRYFLSRKSSYASNCTGGVGPLLVTLCLGKGWDGIKGEEKKNALAACTAVRDFQQKRHTLFPRIALAAFHFSPPLVENSIPGDRADARVPRRLEEEYKWKKKESSKKGERKKERKREREESKRQRQNRSFRIPK